MHDKLLLDCTCLTHLCQLSKMPFYKLGDLVKDHFLIPEHVVLEFEKFCTDQGHLYPTARKLLGAIEKENKYKKCPHREPVIFSELLKVVDPGEAEAIAQLKRLGANLFISNDSLAEKTIIKSSYSDIRFYSTFYLIALADLSGFLPNYQEVVYEYFAVLMVEKMRKGTRLALFKRMKSEYKEALRRKGFNPDNKVYKANINFSRKFSQFQKCTK
jgi:predicted nucleic acid-binding protein